MPGEFSPPLTIINAVAKGAVPNILKLCVGATTLVNPVILSMHIPQK